MIPIAKSNLGKEEVKAASDVILSGWVSQGPKVKEFEEAFAKYVEASHACAVSNCTTALHLALLVLGVKPTTKVITVSHSFISTANTIRYCGAEPVFVDIDPDTYNMDVKALESALEENKDEVSAILTVHQMGMPCNLKEIVALSNTYEVPIIEDAACAVASEIAFDGKKFERIGKPHGDVACFSFHPRKVITTGEGGMITTSNPGLDEKLRRLRHVGMSVSDLERHSSDKIIFEEYAEIGFNYRMTDIQAAIGIEQLKKLPKILKKRREIADIYFKELKDVSWVKLPQEPEYCRSNFQSFPIRILDSAPLERDEIMQALLSKGISTRRGIMNAHQEAPYLDKKLSLPQSEDARDNTILFPLYSTMKKSDAQLCAKTLKDLK